MKENYSPGDISALKVLVSFVKIRCSHVMQSVMVSNSTLAFICVKSGLHDYLPISIRRSLEVTAYLRRLSNNWTGMHWLTLNPPKVPYLQI